MKKTAVLILILMLLAIACNNKGNKQSNSASEMYEYTPLALLMLRMHGDAFTWKGAIEAEVFSSDFPSDYYGIYTVEATDSNIRNDVFVEKADKYLASVKYLTETIKPKKQLKKFNLMISACVDCHAVFCQGPIDKIEKLYIKDAE